MPDPMWRVGSLIANAFALCAMAACMVAPVRPASPKPVEDASVCRPLNPPTDSGPFSWPTYVVFDSHSATLTARDNIILDEFTHRVLSLHASGIVMEAHKDAAEGIPTDRFLDARRAKAVIQYLATAGLREAPTVTLAGNANLLVPTAHGVAEAQNRLVVLSVHGNFDEQTHQAHRILLCRRWTLANCIGLGRSAPLDQCKAAIDSLVRGDAVERNLDWRTDVVP